MRERMNANVITTKEDDRIKVSLTHTLDSELYDHPLTLKTYIPFKWKSILVKQGSQVEVIQPGIDQLGSFVMYSATPNGEPILLSEE